MEEIHANQVVFDDRRTLQEVIASILEKIDAISQEEVETTVITEEGESNG